MNKNMSLVRLSYASFKDKHVDGQELNNILEKAQDFNAKNNISGMMVFNSHYFLQVLEGPRVAVSDLYNIIVSDTRHHHPQLVNFEAIKKRNWKQWSMNFVSITEKEEQLYVRFCGQKEFNPFKIETNSVDSFLSEIGCSVD